MVGFCGARVGGSVGFLVRSVGVALGRIAGFSEIGDLVGANPTPSSRAREGVSRIGVGLGANRASSSSRWAILAVVAVTSPAMRTMW